MQSLAQTAAGGAIVALLILGAGQPMTVRSDGLQFPDGTIQTTAARADTRKAFYITESLHMGSTALSASCKPASGLFRLFLYFELNKPQKSSQKCQKDIMGPRRLES